jgi:hypothetical protein
VTRDRDDGTGDAPSPPGRSRGLLLGAAAAVLVAWQFREGRLALYPFSLLATFTHEMGHGTMAMLLGAHFDRMEMHADGSGIAFWHGTVGRTSRALIAASGLVGPSIAGAAVLVLSRKPERSRLLLSLGASLLVLAALLVVRDGFTLGFVAGTALILGIASRVLGPWPAAFLVQFLGVTLCLSVFLDLGYMFSPGAVVGGEKHVSDSQAIADALFLPYWFWGGVVAATSFAVLAAGLRSALRGR